MNLLTASAFDQAAAIREGHITSTELTSLVIDQCRLVNQHINAIVHDRYGAALAEAKQADALIRIARTSGGLAELFERKPLLGVPCSIKESIRVQGMPNTGGLMNRLGVRADADAPTTRFLREAGAVVMGVTNTSEACMWMESFNTVYGLTRNPYDTSRTVGGSSGGEGAIVGSGAVAFGLGSDVGGSIRMPCFFNGVFGHKSSPGLVSNPGQFPPATGHIDRSLSTGPICRKASDLEPLLRIVAGDNAHTLKPVAGVDISSLTVFTFKQERAVKPDADQTGAVRKAAQALEQMGAKRHVIDEPLMSKAFDLWSAVLASSESEQGFADHLFGSKNPLYAARELARLATGRSQNTLPLVLLTLVERVPELMPRRTQRLVKQAQALRQRFEDALGDDGILITVPYPTVAPRHYVPLIPPFKFINCAIFNALSLPATSVPTGLNRDGLPTGVQIVANEGFDHLGLAGAMALEKALGGWVAPRLSAVHGAR